MRTTLQPLYPSRAVAHRLHPVRYALLTTCGYGLSNHCDGCDLDEQPRLGEMAHLDHGARRQVAPEEFLAPGDDLFELADVGGVDGRPNDVGHRRTRGFEVSLHVAHALPGLLEHAAAPDLLPFVV